MLTTDATVATFGLVSVTVYAFATAFVVVVVVGVVVDFSSLGRTG